MRVRRGFTLIEIIVVVIIAAVMAAVVVPAYSKFYARHRFDAAVQEVLGAFAYAHELAIQKDTPVTLVFDPQSETFAVNGSPQPPPTDQPSSFPDAQSDYTRLSEAHIVSIDPSVRIAGLSTTDTSMDSVNGPNSQPGSSGGRGATTINFRSDGTCDGAEMQVIDPINGYSAHLVLQSGTGRVTVE